MTDLTCLGGFAEELVSGNKMILLTNDGGWCWFSDPRAIVHAGKTWSGWITENGSVQAATLDHSTGTVATSTLHLHYERDDHDHPAFVALPDGRVTAYYARHGREPVLHQRTTTRPGDPSEWDPEVEIRPVDSSPRSTNVTYANPFLLSSEKNRLYLFFRGHSFKPTFMTSDDLGRTWSEARVLVSPSGFPPGNRPYAKFASNGSDSIHIVFTDGHPISEPFNGVYYLLYRDRAFYKADGTRIAAIDDLPVCPGQADVIYNAAQTGVRSWLWDVAFDHNNHPVVVYTRLPSGDDHRYHYARWTGSEWLDRELCAGGGWFPTSRSGEKETEPYYSGGLALDPDDPSTVYLTRPVKGIRELERWETADGGRTWSSEAITTGSRTDNVRPFVPRGSSAGGPHVLWQQNAGRYIHYTDYRASIKAFLPATGPTEWQPQRR